VIKRKSDQRTLPLRCGWPPRIVAVEIERGTVDIETGDVDIEKGAVETERLRVIL
jgi:hypothetical protein